MLKEKPYDLAILVKDVLIRHEDLASFLVNEDHADVFPAEVHACDLIRWGLKCGLKAEVWEDENNCIYALGDTEHLLEIAESIYYPLQLEMGSRAPGVDDRSSFIDGHVLNPAKSAVSEFSFAKKDVARPKTLLPTTEVPPVYLGYSSKLTGGLGTWKKYKIPQSSSSILREVDRSRLCYHGLSEYLNLSALVKGGGGGLASSKRRKERRGGKKYSVIDHKRQEATEVEDKQPLISHAPDKELSYCNPKKPLIRSIHLYRNAELYSKLESEWANWRCLFKQQPFELIRDYFGEEICIYFHFLDTCIRWMSLASVISLGASAINFSNTFVHHSRRFTITRIIMSLTMSLTVSLIYRKWLSQQQELKLKYGISSYEQGLTKRVTLPTFKYTEVVRDPVNPSHSLPQANRLSQNARYLVSVGLSTVAVVVAAMFVNDDLHEYMFARYEVRGSVEAFLQNLLRAAGSFGSSVPVEKIPVRALMTAVIASLFNNMYKMLSTRLTRFENHQFSENYESSFIRKLFLFTAFDYFLPLYNLAFVKVHYDPCWEEDPEYGRCLISLITQMKSIILMALVGNAIELGVPFALKWFKEWRLKKAHPTYSPLLVDELSRGEYDSTSSDFGEVMLILMIGSLFSSAWFTLPLLSLLILVVEIRVDAIKILHLNTRPYPSTGLNMASWNFILDALMNVTIITNVSIIAFTSFGGALSPKIKLAICFFGILLCITLKEAVTNCGCQTNQSTSKLAMAQRKLITSMGI